MSEVFNHVRRETYVDSVALMRFSRSLCDLPGVERAALMIGTPANKDILDGAGLLVDTGRAADANDLIIALRSRDRDTGEVALREAESLLTQPASRSNSDDAWRPRTIKAAVDMLPDANFAIISVPGEFAADEARKALRRGLHVMIFSDNVALEDERALKIEARERDQLLMGPDCGTAIIGGTPLAFANELPRGDIGIISASGTGLQEVSTLLARAGIGISHGIGVGGRDLNDAVGGITTLMALDALEGDPHTRRIVLISKPPGPEVAARVFDRLHACTKPVTVCILGLGADQQTAAQSQNYSDVHFVPTLKAAAEHAMGGDEIGGEFNIEALKHEAAGRLDARRNAIRGVFAGGSLCAEAQVILLEAGLDVYSNAAIPGAQSMRTTTGRGHVLIDAGADEYTRGRPHPMIDPSVRDDMLDDGLHDSETAVLLVDVVLGYGAHPDPAGELAKCIARSPGQPPVVVVASICGTEDDPQVYSAQAKLLERAGVIVAPSNAQAAELALNIARRSQ